jgi:N-acetylglutamate synthase-like GNAT family acetyltransferase
MNIRENKSTDFKDIKAIIDEFSKEELSLAAENIPDDELSDFKAAYSNSGDIVLVAEEDNQVVGFIALKKETKERALLKRLLVHPGYRKRNFGTNLLHRATDAAKIKGYKTLLFHATEKLKPAVNLMLKNGFKQVKINEIDGCQIIELTKDI